ncbi:hypothetical protein SeLEV6574_g08019 [Synchytrium endobioticum]|uniref:Uncharacterized protein n=1 Tax=Synchytrium endobioticum TaxID=286115 RepID=A0A507CC62_9FUNG|nr:hypothetical protein SeLEV6574_g08019 [Synchytrium endobioticum]
MGDTGPADTNQSVDSEYRATIWQLLMMCILGPGLFVGLTTVSVELCVFAIGGLIFPCVRERTCNLQPLVTTSTNLQLPCYLYVAAQVICQLYMCSAMLRFDYTGNRKTSRAFDEYIITSAIGTTILHIGCTIGVWLLLDSYAPFTPPVRRIVLFFLGLPISLACAGRFSYTFHKRMRVELPTSRHILTATSMIISCWLILYGPQSLNYMVGGYLYRRFWSDQMLLVVSSIILPLFTIAMRVMTLRIAIKTVQRITTEAGADIRYSVVVLVWAIDQTTETAAKLSTMLISTDKFFLSIIFACACNSLLLASWTYQCYKRAANQKMYLSAQEVRGNDESSTSFKKSGPVIIRKATEPIDQPRQLNTTTLSSVVEARVPEEVQSQESVQIEVDAVVAPPPTISPRVSMHFPTLKYPTNRGNSGLHTRSSSVMASRAVSLGGKSTLTTASRRLGVLASMTDTHKIIHNLGVRIQVSSDASLSPTSDEEALTPYLCFSVLISSISSNIVAVVTIFLFPMPSRNDELLGLWRARFPIAMLLNLCVGAAWLVTWRMHVPSLDMSNHTLNFGNRSMASLAAAAFVSAAYIVSIVTGQLGFLVPHTRIWNFSPSPLNFLNRQPAFMQEDSAATGHLLAPNMEYMVLGFKTEKSADPNQISQVVTNTLKFKPVISTTANKLVVKSQLRAIDGLRRAVPQEGQSAIDTSKSLFHEVSELLNAWKVFLEAKGTNLDVSKVDRLLAEILVILAKAFPQDSQ